MNDTTARFCIQCGTAVAQGASFCGQCGINLRPAQNPQPSRTDGIRTSRATVVQTEIFAGEKSNSESATDHPALFFVLYVLFLIPTYILPYLGSNSVLVNSVSTAIENGYSPQFWLHLTALYILVVIAWFRGALIGRSWLASLPAIAGIFDLMPGLNWLPLAPTLFHVATLINGVTKEPLSQKPSNNGRLIASVCGLGLLSLIAFSSPTASDGSGLEKSPKGTASVAIAGVWASADTGCGTGYGAGYTAGGRFTEGDEFSGVEGLWTIQNYKLRRETTQKYEGDGDTPSRSRPVHQIDHFTIVKLTPEEMVFDDNGKRFSYVKCREGQRQFLDGEEVKSARI
jgi:hypothetical protein